MEEEKNYYKKRIVYKLLLYWILIAFLIFKFHKNEKFAILIIPETVIIYFAIARWKYFIFIGGIDYY